MGKVLVARKRGPSQPNRPVVKFWDLEKSGLKYRVIYLYNWPDRSYNVMAVIHRDSFDYDNPTDPVRLRVFARCRAEFPRA